MKYTLYGIFILIFSCVGCSNVQYRSIELRCYDASGEKIRSEDVAVFVFTQRSKKVWWESGIPHRLSRLHPTPYDVVDNIPQRTIGSASSLSPIVLVCARGTYPVDISYVSTYLDVHDLREIEPLLESGRDIRCTSISPLRVSVCLPKVNTSTIGKDKCTSLTDEYVIDSFGNPFLLRSSILPSLNLRSLDTRFLQDMESKELWNQLTSLPVLDGTIFQYLKCHFSLEPKKAVKLFIAFNQTFISTFNNMDYAKKHLDIAD